MPHVRHMRDLSDSHEDLFGACHAQGAIYYITPFKSKAASRTLEAAVMLTQHLGDVKGVAWK